ncbi:MOSC domain-containing protein [Oscillatoria sp. FACHB-1407]|uniref:MOSC domain-containing protein n=1 Tax=Oscillatoria sp. FACHB-1407 TaxID=2692847 RepID=UPI0016839BCF|nr:MOSC N-terminal beta barrel domain-containing protein [Oscillatoria sp. FACHB-1407]MBD2465072.1 MOSC domain-containing protein [Oscillatoria sp. FACHB-1407]
MTKATVGTVVSLWRYPVKSMLGEELNASLVTEEGLWGDRTYALLDSHGKTISAKSPRKWGKMFDCRAALEESSKVKITLPDGTVVLSDAAEVNEVLSQAFGQPVKLETVAPAEPSIEMYTPDIDGLPDQDQITDISIRPNTFFDAATLHLLTTATLNQLQTFATDSRFEPRRFRPNLVVQPTNGATGFVENDWVGKTLAIGDDVRLSVTKPCGRCVMTTMAQSELPNDLNILKTVMQHNQGNVGIYASVVQGGTIRRGDEVVVLES